MRQDHDSFGRCEAEVRIPVIVSKQAFSRIHSLRHSMVFRAAIGPLIDSLSRRPVDLASLKLEGLGHLALSSGPASLSSRPYQGCHWIFSVAPTFLVPAAPDDDPDDDPPGGGVVLMLRARADTRAVGFDLEDEGRSATSGQPTYLAMQPACFPERHRYGMPIWTKAFGKRITGPRTIEACSITRCLSDRIWIARSTLPVSPARDGFITLCRHLPISDSFKDATSQHFDDRNSRDKTLNSLTVREKNCDWTDVRNYHCGMAPIRPIQERAGARTYLEVAAMISKDGHCSCSCTLFSFEKDTKRAVVLKTIGLSFRSIMLGIMSERDIGFGCRLSKYSGISEDVTDLISKKEVAVHGFSSEAAKASLRFQKSDLFGDPPVDHLRHSAIEWPCSTNSVVYYRDLRTDGCWRQLDESDWFALMQADHGFGGKFDGVVGIYGASMVATHTPRVLEGAKASGTRLDWLIVRMSGVSLDSQRGVCPAGSRKLRRFPAGGHPACHRPESRDGPFGLAVPAGQH